MKKTLVAVAAIAAFAGAQAQVTITGAIDYAVQSYTTGATKTHTMGGDSNQFNNIRFTASEDLGNGMKASATFDLGLEYGSGTNASQTRESHIDLSSSMGSISLGRQYTPIFLASTVDPVGLPALSVGQEGLNSIFLTQSVRNVRNDGSFAYVSPSFSGFNVNYFHSMASSTVAGSTTGYGIKYAAGSLSAEYQTQSAGNEGVADYTNDDVAGTNDTWTAGTNNTKRQIAAFKYDAGMANFVYIYGTAKNDQLGLVTNYLAVGAPLPGTNFSVAAGYYTGDSTAIGAAANKNDGSIFRINYAFSKRTNAYAIYGSDSRDGAALTTTSSSIGLSHSF